MTIPEIDTLRGSSSARSRRIAKFAAEPARQPGQELLRMQEWPLLSHVELRALPGSVRSARLHTTSILHRWGLGGLADTAELLVSEIITNAVRASTPIVRQQRETEQAPGAQLLRFWLTSDQRSVLIQVWDSNHHGPVRKYVGSDAEAGRGLLLIETLSAQWGWYAPDGQGGKIVWAVCAYLIQTRHLERSRASPCPPDYPGRPGYPGGPPARDLTGAPGGGPGTPAKAAPAR